MLYQSKIIVEIYSYLQSINNKEIEDLFSNSVDLFNALGSWVYGGGSPKIVFPELQLFVEKANTTTAECFSQLLEYINCVCNALYKILEENQWIEEHYYESYTLKQSNDITTGLLFMWRLGWLNVKIKDISNENNIPLPFQLQNAFIKLFDALGGWIYHQEELINITRRNRQFERLILTEFETLYDEVLEEAKRTSNNIKKFFKKL